MPDSGEPRVPRRLPEADTTGEALPMWTYASEELFEIEYEEFFLNGWHMVGHVCDLQQPGDYLTFDLWRDSVIVVRGRDDTNRAFLNVCRHRAFRLVDGKGSCGGAIQCRYHGWSYGNDGRLIGVPSPESFPGLDKTKLGLTEVRLETYRGHLFVNLRGDPPPVASMLAPLDGEIALYAPEGYEPLREPTYEIWECNWKLAWDNYHENYHIAIAHPSLHRLLRETDDGGDLDNGINWGCFEMREKSSSVPQERRYQEGLACTDHRYPEGKRGRWLQIGMDPGMGIEYYPDLFGLFQILPLGVNRTQIKMSAYSPPDMSAEEREIQAINLSLFDGVNAEDKFIVERIQSGAKTAGYQPGPLSMRESSVAHFHDRVRARIPVTRLSEAPKPGTLRRENERCGSRSKANVEPAP